MATRKIFGSFVLFCVFHIIQVLSQGILLVGLSLIGLGNRGRMYPCSAKLIMHMKKIFEAKLETLFSHIKRYNSL